MAREHEFTYIYELLLMLCWSLVRIVFMQNVRKVDNDRNFSFLFPNIIQTCAHGKSLATEFMSFSLWSIRQSQQLQQIKIE